MHTNYGSEITTMACHLSDLRSPCPDHIPRHHLKLVSRFQGDSQRSDRSIPRAFCPTGLPYSLSGAEAAWGLEQNVKGGDTTLGPRFR